MSKLDFSIHEISDDLIIYGLKQKSNDKTQSKDIPVVSKKYYDVIEKRSGEVIPFFVVSKDYNESTRDFEFFIGGLLEHEKLEKLTLPKGLYGKATVKPKMGFLWGLSIGEAKSAFYTKWLPKSDYVALNLEYEYHTEISTGKKPQIDILFAIKQR